MREQTVRSFDEPSTQPEDRAAKQRLYTRLLVLVIILLAAALAAIVAYLFLRGIDRVPAAAAATECQVASLRIVADPSMVGLLDAVREDIAEDGCKNVEIVSENSAVTARNIAAGNEDEFDVWIPESSMWLRHASDIAERHSVEMTEYEVGKPVASTPIVFAATAANAAALESQNLGFSNLTSGIANAVLPNPSIDAASSTGLLAVQTAMGGNASLFTEAVIGLSGNVASNTNDALDKASTATAPTIAVVTEQATLKYNIVTPLVPLFPADVSVAMGVSPITRSDASADVRAGVTELSAAIESSDELLAEYGLRDRSGKTIRENTVADVDSEIVDGVDQAETLYTWQVLTAPSRILAINDVSGSMLLETTPGTRRVDLFAQAGVNAINALPKNTTFGSWAFSNRRIGAQDWQEVLPYGSLDEPEHKQQAIDSFNGLAEIAGGGTGLYDTVLAGVQHMRDTYVEGEVNMILLNTDGYNEDTGLTLEQLLAELEALRDPAKPIPVVAVGYGPDTDQEALEKIAAATDGTAYQALEPTDILTVLVDAVTQRGCRPNCA